MTVLEVLNASTSYLAKHGIDSARLNSEHLLAHLLGHKKRLNLYLEFERPLSDAQRAPLRELVRRRAEGVPLQHLLGTVEFFGREFLCDGRALIPRPETEQLVENVLKRVAGGAAQVVDIGTGSGVIALTFALERPDWSVSAVEISTDAIALAGENRTRHGLGERVVFLEGNLLEPLTGSFDAIVANLPYVASGEIAGLSREVQHDPPLALDGGPDGLDLVRALIADAPPLLAPGGLVALEIGHDQSDRVAELFARHNYRDIEKVRDYQDTERFVFARHG